uniref:Aminoadipate-semialdehyde dehydrogenase n=1 Tax=Oreochromis niloticus TaxID=8128 RepID=A0A669EAC6_ORENI
MSARTLQELVAAAASLHADRLAVTHSVSGKPPVSLTYRDLVQLADEFSRALRKNCSPSSGVIGLYCRDDLFVPVWILGILQSSAAYVPLDPESPGLLSARVMSQCGLKYCLLKFKLTLIHIEPLRVAERERGAGQTETLSVNDLSGSAVQQDDAGCRELAYVLHTSGTTGFPKTVRVPHRCILPNILHLRSLFQMRPDDVVFLASPLTFDPSVVDIFLALSSGAQLLIVPNVIKKMPNRLAELLFNDHKTTVLQVTPTLLLHFGHRILKQDVLSCSSSLRVLALGGEACPSPALLESWRHKDNKTNIYNIYGITEVSCWASLYPRFKITVSSVPLGTPLMGTVVEVRDEHGCVVSEGEGQIFIGGEDRVCLLDDEDTVVPGTMRATGDWVNVKDGQLHYLGRRDRMIKRNGKRVNLDSLQQVLLSLPQVEACAVGLHQGFRLLAFVMASTSGHQKALSLLLPAHSVPDTLVLVPTLCLTAHGKVNMEALVRVYEKQRQCLESSQRNSSELRQILQTLWRDTLNLAVDVTIDKKSNFLLSGGDSLKALHLCEDILAAVGVTSPELLEVILDGTFSDIMNHVARARGILEHENSESTLSQAKRRHDESTSQVLEKRVRKDWTATESLQVEKQAVKVIRRGGEVIEMNIRYTEDDKTVQNQLLGVRESCGEADLGLSLSWSSDTGRCVDASPVLLVQNRADHRSNLFKATVFIGSHSHRIQAVDVATGNLMWERVLGDRIEGSAAVSRCGSLVVIGCYDGCVYFLCTETGNTQWVFETGDAVKSCPAVDPLTGLVVVGSHDGHVYALNSEVRKCVWKCHCGGGAVFSSPRLHPSRRQVYAASLGGHLLCLSIDSGDVLWSYCRDTPFFSSPNCFSEHVVIGSVDGHICCFSNMGKLLWQFLTKGPVFSSPSITSDQKRLLCGSHDGCLYCLNCADGSLVWTFQTTGKVYSTPFVFDGSAVGRRGSLVGLASTDGTVWILDGKDGRMLASHTLPGELFSSPVVWERSLLVGCRNDYVYCLSLSVKKET